MNFFDKIRITTICFFLVLTYGFSQSTNNNKTSKKLNSLDKLVFYDYRGTNAGDFAIGTSIANADLPDAEFDIFFRAGYKRFIFNHLNVNVVYNKFNIAFKDSFSEGYMSFDANLEFLLSPYKRFTFFLFAGGGYTASNYFESTFTKAQGGLGIEYIVLEGLGIKLFGEYNYALTDELENIIAGSGDDAFYRIGLGVNMYFGGKKKKQKKQDRIKTVIKSNPIILKN